MTGAELEPAKRGSRDGRVGKSHTVAQVVVVVVVVVVVIASALLLLSSKFKSDSLRIVSSISPQTLLSLAPEIRLLVAHFSSPSSVNNLDYGTEEPSGNSLHNSVLNCHLGVSKRL